MCEPITHVCDKIQSPNLPRTKSIYFARYRIVLAVETIYRIRLAVLTECATVETQASSTNKLTSSSSTRAALKICRAAQSYNWRWNLNNYVAAVTNQNR